MKIYTDLKISLRRKNWCTFFWKKISSIPFFHAKCMVLQKRQAIGTKGVTHKYWCDNNKWQSHSWYSNVNDLIKYIQLNWFSMKMLYKTIHYKIHRLCGALWEPNTLHRYKICISISLNSYLSSTAMLVSSLVREMAKLLFDYWRNWFSHFLFYNSYFLFLVFVHMNLQYCCGKVYWKRGKKRQHCYL